MYSFQAQKKILASQEKYALDIRHRAVAGTKDLNA